MARRKLDLILLQKLAEEGKTGAAIAKELGCSAGAVSKNLKALGLAKSEDVVMRCAKKINNNRLSVMERLNKAAGIIEKELEYIQSRLSKVSGEDRKELIQSQLSHIAEERKKVNTLVDVARAFYSIEVVRQFQQIILDVIGEIDKEARDEIGKRLREKRSARNILGGDGFQV